MMYSVRDKQRRPKPLIWVAGALVVVMLAAGVLARQMYVDGLKPVNSASEIVQLVTIERGATLDQITNQLLQAGLIRNTWAFKWYAGSKGVKNALQAGTYSFSPSQSVPEIIVQLSHGKVTTDLVTIIPGQRLDQIRTTLLHYGFKETDVDAALDPALYAKHAALADKPAGANLEGFIYPDSYQKDGNTLPWQIIDLALGQMDNKLTPDIRAAFAAHGLSTYQGVILASIVEKEVSRPEDQAQAAQVFLKRLSIGMMLGSDVTAFYGALLAGQTPSVSYDSPYNTRMHGGLPPTPISNVTVGALDAVAHPANSDWLYFVSGDDGVTHFSKTLSEHEANVSQYCKKLCQ